MKKLFTHSLIIVVLTVIITKGVNLAMDMWIFNIAFPEQSALDDFEFEDFAFSTRQTKQLRDENIVLINIGQLGRAGIAEQINILNEYHPLVIGVDVFFNCEFQDTINCPQLLDTIGNNSLHDAIKRAGNIVLVSKLLQSRETILKDLPIIDSLEISDFQFSNFAKNGFANLLTSGKGISSQSCRLFAPSWLVKNQRVNSFSIELCRQVDSIKTKKFLERRNEEEIINYKGNVFIKGSNDGSDGIEYFKTLDYQDVFSKNFDPDLIKNKVVILGYLGDYLLDNRVDQMYYSPLNRIAVGKSLPDMYGVVIHANIISMILREDYIDRISEVNAWVISMIIVILNAMLFVWLYKRNTVWYDALTLLIPVSQIVLIAYLRHLLFTQHNYILDLSTATILLVSVSLSAGLYFGPLQRLLKKSHTQ